MIGKRWMRVSLLVGALVLGVAGGVVLAQEADEPESGSPLGGFASRVAAILGLDESEVQDAFDQAASEIRDEAMQRKLDRLVEQGKLTQEQADEYEEWYQSRPGYLSQGHPFGGFRGHRFGPGRMHGMGFFKGVAPTPSPESSGTANT